MQAYRCLGLLSRLEIEPQRTVATTRIGLHCKRRAKHYIFALRIGATLRLFQLWDYPCSNYFGVCCRGIEVVHGKGHEHLQFGSPLVPAE